MTYQISTNSIAQPVVQVGANGELMPGSSITDPDISRTVGSNTFATGQVANSISPAAAIQIVPARAGRHSVTLVNTTGTQPVYLVGSAVTTGVTTGQYLAATLGASITISTTAAIFSTSPTAAQTIAFSEVY